MKGYGNYPPGVTGGMIDDYFGVPDGCEHELCLFCGEGDCHTACCPCYTPPCERWQRIANYLYVRYLRKVAEHAKEHHEVPTSLQIPQATHDYWLALAAVPRHEAWVKAEEERIRQENEAQYQDWLANQQAEAEWEARWSRSQWEAESNVNFPEEGIGIEYWR